jgi:hypothetical protein
LAPKKSVLFPDRQRLDEFSFVDPMPGQSQDFSSSRKSFENLDRQISEKNDERRLILIKATSMKVAAVFISISLVLASQTFAVLRPLFPVKPEPPLRGGAM